jgi:hypothetical protein
MEHYMNMQPLIDAIRAHALANYTNGGWDEVVEAWDDEDIVAEVHASCGDNPTVEQAIAAVGEVVKLRHGYAEDIRGAGGVYDDGDGFGHDGSKAERPRREHY